MSVLVGNWKTCFLSSRLISQENIILSYIIINLFMKPSVSQEKYESDQGYISLLHMQKTKVYISYAADQRLCACYIDSLISLFPKSETSGL